MLTNAKTYAGFILLAVLSCTACADETYLMHEHFLINADGEERLLSSGCESLSGNGATGAGFPSTSPNKPSFDIQHKAADGGIIVLVLSSDGQTLARRAYSEDFLDARREDTFSVQLPDDESLRLTYWGGPECGSMRRSEKP